MLWPIKTEQRQRRCPADRILLFPRHLIKIACSVVLEKNVKKNKTKIEEKKGGDCPCGRLNGSLLAGDFPARPATTIYNARTSTGYWDGRE